MSSTSQVALEHFSDFIYFAYSFYTCLYEEPLAHAFKSYWLEALGDLARYRMALAAHLAPSTVAAIPGDATTQTLASLPPVVEQEDSGRLTPSPSIGAAAAAAWELTPEREQWRDIARDWYGEGLKDQPGNGKLHHHIGLLCQEDETLRALYHYTKRYVISAAVILRSSDTRSQHDRASSILDSPRIGSVVVWHRADCKTSTTGGEGVRSLRRAA